MTPPEVFGRLCGCQPARVKIVDGQVPILAERVLHTCLAGVPTIVCPHPSTGHPPETEARQQLPGFHAGLRVETHPYPSADKFGIQLMVFTELTYFEEILFALIHGLVLSFEVRTYQFACPQHSDYTLT